LQAGWGQQEIKMKRMTLAVLVALAMAGLSACDRNPDQRAAPAGAGGSATTTPQANTPSTPANAGTPSAAEKKSGSNPVQGQVDPKQGEQHKDFQQRGDGAGPKQGG
jgi:hypothetical protein